MNTTTIEKCIDLCEKRELEELLNTLRYEREVSILSSKGKKPTLLNATKKYLEWIRKNAVNQRLYGVQHAPDDKQFILDGFSMIVFNEKHDELDALPQTEKTNSLNPESLFMSNTRKMVYYDLSKEDKIILANIGKYIKLSSCKSATVPVYLFGGFYNAKSLAPIIDIIGTEFTAVRINPITDDRHYSSVEIKNDLCHALILGMRTPPEQREEIKAQAQKFAGLQGVSTL
jgi:hypothetical protein